MKTFKHCEVELGPASDRLTGQQKAIVVFLAMGLSNKNIASMMHRSPETIAMHVSALLGAFNTNSRAGIVGQAFCHGVLRPSIKSASVFVLGLFIGMNPVAQFEDRSPIRRGPRQVRVTSVRYDQVNLGVLTA